MAIVNFAKTTKLHDQLNTKNKFSISSDHITRFSPFLSSEFMNLCITKTFAKANFTLSPPQLLVSCC